MGIVFLWLQATDVWILISKMFKLILDGFRTNFADKCFKSKTSLKTVSTESIDVMIIRYFVCNFRLLNLMDEQNGTCHWNIFLFDKGWLPNAHCKIFSRIHLIFNIKLNLTSLFNIRGGQKDDVTTHYLTRETEIRSKCH